MVEFTYVDRDAQLRGLVQQWRRLPELAIDLEMEAHLHHYGLHLSLVQVSDGKDTWVVDMLAIQDARSLVELFEDQRVLKVFHDVSFDFRVLEELLDCRPKNVYDTKIAALLAGRESISLGALLEEEFQVQKQEKFQRIDWLQRPLKRDMLAYAAGDVAHLLQLKKLLTDKLKEQGRYGWFKEECRYLESLTYATEERTFNNIKGAKLLSAQQRGVLKELYLVRESLAERLDKPVFFVIPDKILISLAKQPPRDPKGWGGLKGVHPAAKRSAGKFLAAIRRAKPTSWQRPPQQRLSFKQRAALDSLLAKRDKIAARLHVEPYLVLTKEQAINLIVNGNGARSWQRALLSLS